MRKPKIIFHYVSYLQYPLLLVAVYYSFKPFMNNFEINWNDYNNVLIFAGLGISFSTLQDTKKTQNKFSKKVWENPKHGKTALIVISIVTFFFLVLGTIGLFALEDHILKELSLGLLILGIGFIGLLKTAIEMYENHSLVNKP